MNVNMLKEKLRYICYAVFLGAVLIFYVGCTEIIPSPKPTPCKADTDCAGVQTCVNSLCSGLGGVTPPGTRPPPVNQAVGCKGAIASREWSGYGGDVRGLAFGPGSKLVTAAGKEPSGSLPTPGEIRVLDYGKDGVQQTITGFNGGVHKLAFHPDGKSFASASIAAEVIIWDAETYQQTKVLKDHTGEVVGLAFSPDGSMLASGGYKEDSSIRIWSTSTWASVHNITKPFIGYSLSMVFSPDSKKLFSGGYKPQEWDTTTGSLIKELMSGVKSILGVDWSPDGTMISYGLPDGNAILYDVAAGKVKQKWKAHSDRVSAALFARDGKTLITAGLDGKIHFWDTQTYTKLATIDAHPGAIYSLAIHPTGHTLASGGSDGTVRSWTCNP